MSVEAEVLRIRKQMESTDFKTDSERLMDLLGVLSKLDVTLDILTTTRIGMTVNKIRKSSDDDEVVVLAKSLIKTWKKFLPDYSADKNGKTKAGSAKEVAKSNAPIDEDSCSADDVKFDKNGSNATLPPSGASDSKSKADLSFGQAKTRSTADEMRLKCREMLKNALLGDGKMPDGVFRPAEEIACLVEDAIFEKFRDTGVKYKNQLRSRVFNLKDKKNPSLRENVLCGVITPEKLASMTSEEMASDEVKQQRQSFIQDGINASRLATVEGTHTDLIKCGKCNKRNCTYNQIQTRSADEPMTTFVLCNECGNRWKFN